MQELFNNFPEFVLFGTAVGFYIVTAIFIGVLFVSELTENGWLALISFVLFSLLTRWQGNFDITEYVTLKLLGIYLVIGLGHSVIRTYFYGRKRGKEKLGLKEDSWQYVQFDDTTKIRLKRNVFRWWFLFPISFLTWVFSDLLRDTWNQLYDWTKRMFEYILNLGVNSVK